MLSQFTYKNFKSFQDEACLDFKADNSEPQITEFSDHLIAVGKEKLLPLIAVYGPNAAGKSNLVAAFTFMRDFVLYSAYAANPDKVLKHLPQLEYEPFLGADASKATASSFQLVFSVLKDDAYYSYVYGFEINCTEILAEWLYGGKIAPAEQYRQIFSRKGNELDLKGITKKYRQHLLNRVNKENLLLSLGAKQGIPELSLIYDQFLKINIADSKRLYNRNELPSCFFNDLKQQAELAEYLSLLDPSIVKLAAMKMKADLFHKQFEVTIVHKTADGKTIAVPLESESTSIIKMCSLYPLLHDSLTNGGILVIDELGEHFNLALSEKILQNFLTPTLNPLHAQLVFTAHDSKRLNASKQFLGRLLRRDEILFIRKTAHCHSVLYHPDDPDAVFF